MNEPATIQPAAASGFLTLPWWRGALFGLAGAGCFHLAYQPAQSGVWSLAIFGYVFCVTQLARLCSARKSFYTAFGVGFVCVAPQLAFFWKLFGAAAIALWLILPGWLAVFVALTRLALVKLGPWRASFLVPFFWTGLEYFRSELYYLKFSWLNVGYALSGLPLMPYKNLGGYGLGTFAACLAGALLFLSWKRAIAALIIVAGFSFVLITTPTHDDGPQLTLAGVQLEFPDEDQVLPALDRLVATYPHAELLVLSEYTLKREPTEALKDWCRAKGKFLLIGGQDNSPGTNYFNTAFVIGTNGAVVFQQAKRKPIQFFKDGLPAPDQKVWESPWGKIGIGICYDLSYTRITDPLVRLGAQLLIIPTMDVADWGQHQHDLHARVAPVRAAEYGVPIFRVASSGISQGVSRFGLTQASAPFPGEGEMLSFTTRLVQRSSLPPDRLLAPLCLCVTGIFILRTLMEALQRRRSKDNA
jgi:apolipoprotein N-acyltransferase